MFFIPSRDIRNNIVLVNSLIDANTDGVIMMLDWAKAYDSVNHGYLENVLFCMGCDGIGLQRLMSTAKGFTLRVIGSQSVSEPFSREREVWVRDVHSRLFSLPLPLSHCRGCSNKQ